MSTPLRRLSFGVEIEVVGEPWKVREGWRPQQYYDRLQKALENRGLAASVDRPDHYDKWFITTDASLHAVEPQVSLEAVSPKMTLNGDYTDQIKLFWESLRIVFKVQMNPSAGTHIHIGSLGANFSLDDAKRIAFAACIYEPYVFSLLPTARRDNPYCVRNSKRPGRMGELFEQRTPAALRLISNDIKACADFSQLVVYMQGSGQDVKSRRTLWNFQNLARGPTAGYPPTYTVEFRGGRHMRGHLRTLAWLSFAVTFIAMALQENLVNSPGPYCVSHNGKAAEVARFWTKLRSSAKLLKMDEHLPSSFKMMSEKEPWA